MQDRPQQASSSITALSVAAAFMRYLESNQQDWFDEMDLVFTRLMVQTAIASERSLLWAAEYGFSQLPNFAQTSFFNTAVYTGYDTYISMRKLMISEKIDQAIKSGTKQVVFLGGGYDVRAFMAAKQHPDISFFELDRGRTRQIKMKALDQIKRDHVGFRDHEDGTRVVNDNLRYIDCDLANKKLNTVLTDNGYQLDSKTLIIAEGLTMYLSSAAMNDMMKSLSALLNQGDEVVLSFLSQQDTAIIAKLVRYFNGEEYNFSLEPGEVCKYVNHYGFGVIEKANHSKMFLQAGDGDRASYCREHPELHKECYYMLQRVDAVLDFQQDIKNIPDVEYASAEKAVDSSGLAFPCSIL